MVGGNGRSTEYISSNGDVSLGPDLPSPRSGHCMVSLPSGKVMIMGGRDNGENLKSVIIFDPNTNLFDTSVPSLIKERNDFACVVFNSQLHEMRSIVIAIGGGSDEASSYVTAEIYDFTYPGSSWIESKISLLFLLVLAPGFKVMYNE